MFAINHAATALVIKKMYGTVPMVWILISVQVMELLWVLLNFIGLERTTTDREARYVGNIHLSEMPYSHSLVTMSGAAVMSWLVLSQGLGRPDIGAAFGLGIASHLILDLITHDRDIPVAPFITVPKFGLGLYSRAPGPCVLCGDWVRALVLVDLRRQLAAACYDRSFQSREPEYVFQDNTRN